MSEIKEVIDANVEEVVEGSNVDNEKKGMSPKAKKIVKIVLGAVAAAAVTVTGVILFNKNRGNAPAVDVEEF